MASWANVLHFYQPYKQKREIIEAIAAQCYRPIAEGILAEPKARITINFTGVLLDQLVAYGFSDILDLYAEAARRGQLEFVGSAKYHTTLPLLEPDEAMRQMQINDETNAKYFGNVYTRRGIFLPEMAYAPAIAPLIEQAGFDWVLLDELAYNGRMNQVDYTRHHIVEGTNLKALFREHRLSATIMSAGHRDVEGLKHAARDDLAEKRMIVTAMDGETFGHHRIGHEQLLFGMFADPDIPLVRASELLEQFTESETIPTTACTWASSEYDIEHGVQFITWNDPHNEIHQLQWELLHLATKTVHEADPKAQGYEKAREQLDPALASDQFFWASAKPWWMVEYIETGAHWLRETIEMTPGAPAAASARARELYDTIMSTSWEWQRTGKITPKRETGQDDHVRIPLRERTVERGGIHVAEWQAYLDILKDEELAAAERGDYEGAILWRDARYKLEHKLDVYDAWYVTDLLKARLPNGTVEKRIQKYKAAYDHIRGGQTEQRSN